MGLWDALPRTSCILKALTGNLVFERFCVYCLIWDSKQEIVLQIHTSVWLLGISVH